MRPLDRRLPSLGRIVRLGQVGTLDAAAKDQKLFEIELAQIKGDEIELWSSVQGAALASKLSAIGKLESWNSSWNQAGLLAPQINVIVTKLNAPANQPPNWTWSVDEDTAVTQWIAAVTNLYNIMQMATGEQPIQPGPGPGPVQPPPPVPPGTPDSTTSDIVLYAVGGAGLLAIAGTILYALTR